MASLPPCLFTFTYDIRACAIQTLTRNNDTGFERLITVLLLRRIVSSVGFVFASRRYGIYSGVGLLLPLKIMNTGFILDMFDQWDYRIHVHLMIKSITRFHGYFDIKVLLYSMFNHLFSHEIQTSFPEWVCFIFVSNLQHYFIFPLVRRFYPTCFYWTIYLISYF